MASNIKTRREVVLRASVVTDEIIAAKQTETRYEMK
jgi:hypothetical protein